ncbi:MAG TPA: hydroxymethylpyrimidine/phosphomethylpyrimidine kinase [Acidobacteriaceae bacterium]|jgi:hydroxymethylpyrimidine/phosphomethylpyrimidine kinase|nr:hydroxymethylpyrimidine/phosphomethylpyrimidine kinase [Acidobacteriaceae bacterium]
MTVLSKSHRVKQLVREPLALTIAGLDPTGGAGATRDLQVMAAQGVFGVTALTALTVQSTQGVKRVDPVDPELLRDTLKCLGDALGVSASGIAGVKIGMLGRDALVAVVAEWLQAAEIPRVRIVLDPVIRSSSGAELLEPAGVRRLVDELLPLVGWVTPNLEEAGALLGEAAPGREGVPAAAARIQALAPGLAVVVTGGHLDRPEDFLRTATGEQQWFPGPRIEPRGRHGSHGTGCGFSTALLCRLLLGDDPVAAVAEAKAFVVRELEGVDRA